MQVIYILVLFIIFQFSDPCGNLGDWFLGERYYISWGWGCYRLCTTRRDWKEQLRVDITIVFKRLKNMKS